MIILSPEFFVHFLAFDAFLGNIMRPAGKHITGVTFYLLVFGKWIFLPSSGLNIQIEELWQVNVRFPFCELDPFVLFTQILVMNGSINTVSL